MSPFALAGVLGCGAVALLLAVGLWRREHRAPAQWLWLLVWTLAAVAFARPQWTTQAAKAVGIGRGADALLYCAVLAGLVFALRQAVAQRRLERQITLLVRALALQSPHKPDRELP